MDIACISRHLLLPYNSSCPVIAEIAPASAGIYCFLITIINKWSHIPFIDTYHGTLKQFYYL